MKDEIISIIYNEFNEPSHFLIEGGIVSFEVYRGDYEDAPKKIISHSKKIKLKLVNKFDDRFFTLVYDIIIT